MGLLLFSLLGGAYSPLAQSPQQLGVAITLTFALFLTTSGMFWGSVYPYPTQLELHRICPWMACLISLSVMSLVLVHELAYFGTFF